MIKNYATYKKTARRTQYVNEIYLSCSCSETHERHSLNYSHHAQQCNSIERSHVVSNKDGIELITEEAIAKVHSLFLSA